MVRDLTQMVGKTSLFRAVFSASGTHSSNRNMVQYIQFIYKRVRQVGVRGGN